ncbi:MAG TPA: BON domain-containing protein [Isosphaeraceae bacterium]|jgi:hypothetical protein
MTRPVSAALLGLTVLATITHAQGPLQRAGQALDNTGRNIRRGVENAVTRSQITAQERELLGRVSQRLTYDKQLAGSALRLTVGSDGAVVLQGSVAAEAARSRAVDLAESTLGVTAVVDELAVVQDVKVIQAAPAQVIVAPAVETRVVAPRARVVVPPGSEVVVPPGTAVIERR